MGPGCTPDASQQAWLQLSFLTKVVSVLDIGQVSLLRPPKRGASWSTWEPHLYPSPLCPGTFGDVYYSLSISRLRLQSFLQT